MSAVIPADITINETIVAKIIDEQFGLLAKKIVLLGEGFDNAVYLVNDLWVFRLPRRAEAVQLIATEMRILPLLHERLPVTIPLPQFLGVASETFARPFYGHEIIRGESGSRVRLTLQECGNAAQDLGIFLRTLHDIDVNILGVAPHDFPLFFDRCDFSQLGPLFEKRLQEISVSYNLNAYRKKIVNIVDNAREYERTKDHLKFIHGDMYHRHLIFNAKHSLAGIIDWGDTGIGDCVADLGIVYQFFPAKVRARFFDSYGTVDEQVHAYARFLGLYYAATLLWFGHDRQDQDLIHTSLWTLSEI